MITRLPFAAPLVYSPRGTELVSVRSRQLRDRIKRADPILIPQIAEHVAGLVGAGLFGNCFGNKVTLIFVPGHAPLAPGAKTVAHRIADALLAEGLAADVHLLVERTRPVPKSATAAPGKRPTATTHHDSMGIAPALVAPRRILLVDDVVTRGATMIAAATRLLERFPGIEIRAFAVLRTLSDGEIEAIKDPSEGAIEYDGDRDQTRRRP